MDPVTQSALGSSLAQSRSSSKKIWPATILGCLGGLAPDLDILIFSRTDPLLFLEYHRQFTHSLLFIPVGAFIVALFSQWFFRNHLSFKETYVFCFLGYLTHGLLDACTTYGTLLLWPFSYHRFAWNNISIMDPLFTIPILGLIFLSAKRKTSLFGRIAIAWALTYLTIGLIQRDRAIEAGHNIASSRGHQPTRLEAKPSFGNLVLWKIVYQTEGFFYVDAVRMGTQETIYSGTRIEKLDVRKHFPWLNTDSQQFKDIERFRWFSNDYLAVDKVSPKKIIDIRYSMIPNEIAPMWGIVLSDHADPAEHVKWTASRELSKSDRRKFWAMLLN